MQDHPLRLLVLSDQALFRTSLARFLAGEAGLEIVRECASSEEALTTLGTSAIDVVLLDYDKSFMDAARSAGFEGRFLVLADRADAERVALALQQGASGIFQKSEAPERLVLAIRLVAAGALWVDRNVIPLLTVAGNQADNRHASARLEEREARVIQGIMEGHTTRRIGDDLDLSEGAVKNILQVLFAKTGVRKRSQLVRLALEGSLGGEFVKAVSGH